MTAENFAKALKKQQGGVMWINKEKYEGKEFIGNYELQKDGTTRFHLICGKKTLRFRSYGEAKRKGWRKA